MTLHRSTAYPNWWARGAKWPLWVLFAALVGAVLFVPGLRAAVGLEPAGASGAQDAPGAPAATHNHAVVPAAATSAVVSSEGWTMTSFGPLGPADRELLVKVRQAGLWEGPAGELTKDHAAAARVKEVGVQLAADHHGLDTQVRQAAAQLGVALPDQASAEQQGWVKELTAKRGADFDTTFANRLRAAHGKVFALVASVRSGTRNELVRSFAQTAINVVMKHMTLLESIGKVDFNALPEPVGAASTTTATKPAPVVGRQNDAIWLVVALALLGGGTAAVRAWRTRRSRTF